MPMANIWPFNIQVVFSTLNKWTTISSVDIFSWEYSINFQFYTFLSEFCEVHSFLKQYQIGHELAIDNFKVRRLLLDNNLKAYLFIFF